MDRRALRLTQDEWLAALGSSPWDESTREKVDHELWRLAQEVLRLGLSVVLDFGLWARSNVTRCDPWLVASVSASNCTSSTCLPTNSGGVSRRGTRSLPETVTRSVAPTSTGGDPVFRRPSRRARLVRSAARLELSHSQRLGRGAFPTATQTARRQRRRMSQCSAMSLDGVGRRGEKMWRWPTSTRRLFTRTAGRIAMTRTSSKRGGFWSAVPVGGTPGKWIRPTKRLLPPVPTHGTCAQRSSLSFRTGSSPGPAFRNEAPMTCQASSGSRFSSSR